MDMDNIRSWASQPDVCRCCLSTSGKFDLTASYLSENGIKEVYSEMLQECYGITLSCLTGWGPSRLMCTLCVEHLRDACSFRKQVLQAEKHYLYYYCSNREGSEEVQIKSEAELDVSELCHDEPLPSDDEKTTPVKKRRRVIKRKRGEDDSDSDAPLARLSKKSVPSVEVDKAHNLVEKMNKAPEVIEKESNDDQFATKGPLRIVKSKKIKTVAESYVDNKYLRSNITLLLKNSTILPFKHTNNTKYICFYCEKSFLFFNKLRVHVTENHLDVTEGDIMSRLKTPKDLIKADLSEIVCRLCGEKHKNIEELIKHLTHLHRKVYFQSARLKPSHGILGFDLSSETLKCHVCEKEFGFFKNLSVHMNEHSDYFICHFCGKKFVSDHRLQTHIAVHRQSEIRCKVCGKYFRTLSARSYHVRKIHNDSKFKCPECLEVFSQYNQRLRHLVERHNIKKPDFKCDLCSKEFASSGGLGAHVRYSHLKNKEFSCEVCGKVFLYKWIWQRHVDAHSGIKKYECVHCHKKFGKPYTLKIHTRIHLNDKRFVCSVCKAAFVQKCGLKNHLRVHHASADIDLSKL